MPELPDVEGFRRTVAEHGRGHRIRGVEVLDPGVLRGVSAEELRAALSGHRLREPYRHGKWLLAHTDGPTVLLHFGMTGELRWAAGAEPRQILAERQGAVKAVLIDQSQVAGLGNLLADEILWRARVYPRQPAAALTDRQHRRLYQQLHSVLRESVRAGRVPPRPSWLTGVRDQRGGHCPRCGTELRRDSVGGRGTVWCPRCQPSASPM